MTKVNTSYNGSINVTKEVTQTTTKTIAAGQVVVDRKTGERLEFIGTVRKGNFNCPYVFVALDARPSDGNSRRHSADYVAKYLA